MDKSYYVDDLKAVGWMVLLTSAAIILGSVSFGIGYRLFGIVAGLC